MPLTECKNHLPRQVVLLRHEIPGSPIHIDWMLASGGTGHEPLTTFRIMERLDTMKSGGAQLLEPLNDHRPRYLHCDGPLGAGRGGIRRLARGRAWQGNGSALVVQWRTGPATGKLQRIRFFREDDGSLHVHCEGWGGTWN